MQPIIELKDLSKDFIISRRQYGLKSLLLHMPQYVNDTFLHPNKFRALDKISLDIMPGETVGFIGHNGCGKTTLLSIIGGVLRQFEGKVAVHGRVGMMLALGAGFASELSGRENIMLNGVLQGITRREMAKLVDEIIDFAGIEDFIDSPLYQYSSGMQTRLGFAVTTAIRPEILLVDEVMAVGDADFAHKCKRRMGELLANNTTLILVSHSMEDIKAYCNRVVKLEHGRVVHDGAVSEYFTSDMNTENHV